MSNICYNKKLLFNRNARKIRCRNVIKRLKEFSEKLTPTASAVLPVANDMANQFVLPTKNQLIRTPTRCLPLLGKKMGELYDNIVQNFRN